MSRSRAKTGHLRRGQGLAVVLPLPAGEGRGEGERCRRPMKLSHWQPPESQIPLSRTWDVPPASCFDPSRRAALSEVPLRPLPQTAACTFPRQRIQWRPRAMADMVPMRFPYFIGWSLSRLLFRFYFGWRVYHPERVPAEGPVILAANHASYIDPLLVGAGLPRELNYLARDSLFHYPVLATVLRAVNVVPVDREGASPAGLKAILDRLLAGAGIVLFPEGTRTPADGAISLKRGAANIAVRAPCNITPVRIRCAPPMLVKGEKWWRLPPRSSRFSFDVMEDIDIRPFLAAAGSAVLAARQLTGYLQEIFEG